MKVPLRWLAEYVDLSTDVREFAERLTLAGLEVSGFRFYGLPVPEGVFVRPEDLGPVWDPDKVVVAEVLRVEKHPNADKLKLVTVNYGAATPKTVVTGAPNLHIGDQGVKVVLGLAGTRYFDGHVEPKQIKELKPGKLRGIESDAMVMSEFELGISEEHEGIIILEPDAPVGRPLVEIMGDVVLEIDVLPNMARCLSLIGIAREAAALTRQRYRTPEAELTPDVESIEGRVRVSIEKPSLSARYRAMLLRDVRWGPAPGWMRRRLAYAGMRPISNIVDITNYVMLEWGQPLHAFDYDILQQRAKGHAPHIIVRPARPGEKLTTLDGQERTLSPEMLVIADEVGPIALAGVMGGLETEVTERTRNVLLESASFDFVSIRRTMRALNLPSEASLRFSRGVHPELVAPAANRAASLMAQWAGAKVCAGVVDCYPAPSAPQIIDLPLSEIERHLGLRLAKEEVRGILTALDFAVDDGGNFLRVTTPPHRLDIQEGVADLIEEIARIHGYDRLPATLPAERLPEPRGNRSLALEEQARDLLVQAGLFEAITYSLTTPEREAPLTGMTVADESAYVRIVNPINADRTVMRRTILAGLLDVVAENLKHQTSVKMFEIGPVYLPRSDQAFPDEPRRLGIVMTGRRHVESWADASDLSLATIDFWDLKGLIESLLSGLHIPSPEYHRSSVPWLHPGKAAEVRWGEQVVGHLGELHPRTAARFGKEMANRAVLVAELDLEAILERVPDRHRYLPVSAFAPALRDIAIVVPEDTPAAQVLAEIREAGGEWLREARLFDLYRGDSIPAGRKSLAFSLVFQADRNLTDKDVDKLHRKIEDRLKHVLKAAIRGK
jgi:phenylalanyl-tRNA synthetase beta chain